MSIKELSLEESNYIFLQVYEQYYDDRLFEIYKLENLFSNEKCNFNDYKEKTFKKDKKEIDVVEVKRKTDKALQQFIKSQKEKG
nr:MAG TPA: hypothetical protein [Caudoviricetes sp.]